MRGGRGVRLLLWILAAGVGAAAPVSGVESWEQAIRAAEDRHRAAFLARDVAALQDLFADDFFVNSPMSVVAAKDQVIGLVKSGVLTLASFTQKIEQMQRFGDIVVVMGADAVEYAAPAPNAGQTDHRRFTDLWRLQHGRWRFVARHANVLCR